MLIAHWFLLLIFLALIAGAVALVVVAAIHWSSHPQAQWQPPAYPPPGSQQALAELDLRYARGELERDEYLQRRADLLGHPGMPPFGPGTTPPS